MKEKEIILFDETVDIANSISMGQYEELKKKGILTYFSEEEVKRAIREYGGDPSIIDKEKYAGRFDCYKRTDDTYETELDMIIDGKLSDLTLMCEMQLKGKK